MSHCSEKSYSDLHSLAACTSLMALVSLIFVDVVGERRSFICRYSSLISSEVWPCVHDYWPFLPPLSDSYYVIIVSSLFPFFSFYKSSLFNKDILHLLYLLHFSLLCSFVSSSLLYYLIPTYTVVLTRSDLWIMLSYSFKLKVTCKGPKNNIQNTKLTISHVLYSVKNEYLIFYTLLK